MLITYHQVVKPVNCKTNRTAQVSITTFWRADIVQKHPILAENLNVT